MKNLKKILVSLVAFFSLYAGAEVPELRVFVVDVATPGVANEFEDLKLAIHDLCPRLVAEQLGVIEIRRTRPMIIAGELALPCRIKIERAAGARVELRSESALAISAPAGIALTGIILSAPSVNLNSGGAVELDGNIITASMMVHLSGHGGAQILNNQLSKFELNIAEMSASTYKVTGNRASTTKSTVVGSELKLSGVTPQASMDVSDNQGFGLLDINNQLHGSMDLKMGANVVSRMGVKLCGNEVATVNTRANTSDGLKLSFGLPSLTWNDLDARHPRMAFELVRCAGFTAPEIKVVAAIENVVANQGLSFDSPAGLPFKMKLGMKEVKTGTLAFNLRHKGDAPCLDLTAEQAVVSGDFRYSVRCSAKTNIKQAEVGGAVEVDVDGNVQEIALTEFHGKAGVYLDATGVKAQVDFTGKDVRAQGDISLRHLLGIPVRIGIDGAVAVSSGQQQAGLIISAESFKNKSLRKNQSEDSVVVIKNVQLHGETALLNVQNLKGTVKLENIQLKSRGSSMMQPGGIWINDIDGPVDLDNVISIASCVMSCRPLILNRVGKVIFEGGHLENTYGSVMDSDATDMELRNVQMVGAHGGQQFPALWLMAGAEPRRILIEGGSVDGDMITAGPVVVNMHGVSFAPGAHIQDGGNSSTGFNPGSFVSDPIRSNSGLSEEQLGSVSDWDGNECRDYPGDRNIKNEDGLCAEDGFSPPRW
ncbi:MAG: hypothetical protein A2X86_16200 [Bdellovibrionales bacterium GWA2_49_15]|nr:MAG: hypothetical protein A2X86_16200 [Bdellovibrionales bacterium GWA2_49_15]HAZ13648.1 hypothetical protein [Bdellovibrionales bacterium]